MSAEIIAAFNAAAAGALTATQAHTSADRGRGGGTIRLEISGTNIIGTPFHLTSLPIASNADLPSVAAAMANTARAYEQVARAAAPVIRRTIMAGEISSRMAAYRAKRQSLFKEFDSVMTEADQVYAQAHDGIDQLKADIATVKQETADMRGELASLTNGGPPLSDGASDKPAG